MSVVAGPGSGVRAARRAVASRNLPGRARTPEGSAPRSRQRAPPCAPMVAMPERWHVKPGQTVRLAEIGPASTSGAPGGRDVTEADFSDLHTELGQLQERLWAEARQSLLVVLQAMDTGGKDGTIRHVFAG